jgi:hypothetical protein
MLMAERRKPVDPMVSAASAAIQLSLVGAWLLLRGFWGPTVNSALLLVAMILLYGAMTLSYDLISFGEAVAMLKSRDLQRLGATDGDRRFAGCAFALLGAIGLGLTAFLFWQTMQVGSDLFDSKPRNVSLIPLGGPQG